MKMKEIMKYTLPKYILLRGFNSCQKVETYPYTQQRAEYVGILTLLQHHSRVMIKKQPTIVAQTYHLDWKAQSSKQVSAS